MSLQYNKDQKSSLAPLPPNLQHNRSSRQSQSKYEIPLSHPKHWTSQPHTSRYTDQDIEEILEEINQQRCEAHKNYFYDPEAETFVRQDIEELKKYPEFLRKYDELSSVLQKKRQSRESVGKISEHRLSPNIGRRQTLIQKIRNYFKGGCLCVSKRSDETHEIQNQDVIVTPRKEDDVYCCLAFGRCCLACWCCIFTCLTCGLFNCSGLVRTDSDLYPRSVMKLPTVTS